MTLLYMTYDDICRNIGRLVGKIGENREEKWGKIKEI